mgnify:FL=1
MEEETTIKINDLYKNVDIQSEMDVKQERFTEFLVEMYEKYMDKIEVDWDVEDEKNIM